MQKQPGPITDLILTSEEELINEEQEYKEQNNLAFDSNQIDWFSTSLLPFDENTDLSLEQCEETFKLFLLSGIRLSQMTRTYNNDVDAMMLLLEEKERDLELAAHIGQMLLNKNKAIAEHNEILEEQLNQAVEEASQLRHEIRKKENLLHIYADSDDSSSANSSVKDDKLVNLLQSNVNGLRDKISDLQDDNQRLLDEKSQMDANCKEMELKGQELVCNTVQQLNNLQSDLRTANTHLQAVTDELSRRSVEASQQEGVIRELLGQIVDLQNKHVKLTTEHEQIQTHLSESSNSQFELSQEVCSLESRYKEVLSMLNETKQATQFARNSSLDSDIDSYIPFERSLAAEIQNSTVDVRANELSSSSPSIRTGHSDSTTYNNKSYNSVGRSRSLNRSIDEVKICNRDSSSPSSMFKYVKDTPRSVRLSDFKTRKFSTNLNHSPTAFSTTSKTIKPTDASQSDTRSCKKSWTIENLSLFGLSPHMGQPGVPGTADLEQAIEKLTCVGRAGLKYLQQTRLRILNDKSLDPKTEPDAIGVSVTCQQKGTPKLRIVKPLEGSETLDHWKTLAGSKSNLSLTDQASPPSGVVMRGSLSGGVVLHSNDHDSSCDSRDQHQTHTPCVERRLSRVERKSLSPSSSQRDFNVANKHRMMRTMKHVRSHPHLPGLAAALPVSTHFRTVHAPRNHDFSSSST